MYYNFKSVISIVEIYFYLFIHTIYSQLYFTYQLPLNIAAFDLRNMLLIVS